MLVGAAGVALLLRRLLVTRASEDIDLGEVSESWLREKRAEDPQDRFRS